VNGKQKRLGEILIEKSLITSEKLRDVLEEQKNSKELLGAILLRMELIKEKDLLEVLSEQFHLPVVNLKNKYIDWESVKLFSASLILDYKCFPIEINEWSVTFAITNPLDARVLQKAEEEAKGLRAKFILVLQEDMNDVIQRYKQQMRGNISKFFK
jgi:hypothetical protein